MLYGKSLTEHTGRRATDFSAGAKASCAAVLDDFAGVWLAHAGAGHPGLRFLRAVASHFKGLLAGVLALRVVNDMLSFVGPLALEQIIGWLTDPRQRRPWWEPAGVPARWRGVYYIGVMSAVKLVNTGIRIQQVLHCPYAR